MEVTEEDRRLLETLLVAQVLVLERELRREAEDKDVRRVGGDYVIAGSPQPRAGARRRFLPVWGAGR